MTDKPYADIRRALVEGIRNSDKPANVKAAAEVLISTIDEINANGENDDNRRAFQENYARFLHVAKGEPFPAELSPDEIAKAFGLGDGAGHQ